MVRTVGLWRRVGKEITRVRIGGVVDGKVVRGAGRDVLWDISGRVGKSAGQREARRETGIRTRWQNGLT
jgi:hypothetical protein